MTNSHELYMQRCIELAQMGRGMVAPNPMVGAVLVYADRIIGEGYHELYGGDHAEVNCINSVSAEDNPFIPLSTLYVSLEPCAHFGKTPPCSDLIIQKAIKKVVIGCRDPFAQVNGRGIEKLENEGVEVLTGILEKNCTELNKRFFCFHTRQRPYIILKWAQTANGRIGSDLRERLLISNLNTNRLVHKWRSEESAILIGTNTALLDDPSLTNRLWSGNSPVRMVLDLPLRLPQSLKIYNRQQPTVIFNQIKKEQEENLTYYRVTKQGDIVEQILAAGYALQLQSILVEGGAKLLQSFINSDKWDEARIITNEELVINRGLHAPLLKHHNLVSTEKIFSDTIHYYGKEGEAEGRKK